MSIEVLILAKSINFSKSFDQSDPKPNMNEAWARAVDLPGLEDNISPSNNIEVLYGLVVNEVSKLAVSNNLSYNRLGFFSAVFDGFFQIQR